MEGSEYPFPLFPEGMSALRFPDSMVSLWLFTDKPGEYFLPEYHGKVLQSPRYSRSCGEKGMPEDNWEHKPSKGYGGIHRSASLEPKIS